MNMSDSARLAVSEDEIHEFATMCLDSVFLRDFGKKMDLWYKYV